MRVESLAAILLTIATPAGVLAQGTAPAPAAAPAAGHYTTTDTDVGTLLDDPASKAVLDKNIPGFSANPQIQMARSMTLRQLQQFDSAALPDSLMSSIDADLAKLPAKP